MLTKKEYVLIRDGGSVYETEFTTIEKAQGFAESMGYESIYDRSDEKWYRKTKKGWVEE